MRGFRHTRAVIPNGHRFVSADGSPTSNICGAIQLNVHPNDSKTGTLKEELVRCESPKSTKSGLSSSDFSTGFQPCEGNLLAVNVLDSSHSVNVKGENITSKIMPTCYIHSHSSAYLFSPTCTLPGG